MPHSEKKTERNSWWKVLQNKSQQDRQNKEEKYWTEKKEQKKGKEKEKNFETEQYELTVCQ